MESASGRIRFASVSLKPFGKEKILKSKQAGAALRTLMNTIEKKTNIGDCILVDFDGVDLISSKACDIIATELIKRHTKGKRVLWGKYLILTGINDEIRHTVDLVMRLKNDAVLIYTRTEGAEIVGHYPAFLENTFHFIRSRGIVRAQDVSDHLDISKHVAAERLRRLTEWGFVVREVSALGSRRDLKPVYQYSVINPYKD